MKRVSIILFSFLFIIQLSGQEKIDSIMKIIDERGEVYVELRSDNRKSVHEAYLLPGFDKVDDEGIKLYLGKSDMKFISENIHEIRIEKAPSMLFQYSMTDNREDVFNGTAYASYDLYLDIMSYFRDTWPQICSIDTIGYTIENRLLLAARLEKQTSPVDQKPSFFYSSSMHGDETAGYSLMLILINELLTRNEESEINSILENTIIHINPLENPDGTFFSSDSTVFGATRWNANGVDLNRDYPGPLVFPQIKDEDRQKETIAMMNYLQKIKPHLSANFHGGAEVVNYPFDFTYELHADDEWFQFISHEYADTAIAVWPGYLNLYPGGITNGAAWYRVNGGRQDYVSYYLRGRELTIELYDTKTAPESILNQLWQANKKSLLNHIRQAGYGIHGFVTDSLSGEGLEAEISIPEYDVLNSEVFSDPERNGFFIRYLKEGVYSFNIQKEGYLPKTVENFYVSDYERNDMEIKLVPVAEIFEKLKLKLSSDPYDPELKLSIENPEDQKLKVRIFDINGRFLYNVTYNLGKGYSEIQLINDFGSNIIFIQLEFENENQFFKVVKIK